MQTQLLSAHEKNFDELSDLLQDIFTTILITYDSNCFPYHKLDADAQTAIRIEFFYAMKERNIRINDGFLVQFQQEHKNSCLNKIFSSYKANTNVSVLHDLATQMNDLINNKVTLVYFSEFGYPMFQHTTIKQCTVSQYAQFSDTLKIEHIPKRKRLSHNLTILPHEKIMVFEGWLSIDPEIANLYRYKSFDASFFQNVLKQLKHPVAIYN
ncbi:hypothetical protein [Bacillus sp. Marseille-P3800]|uniref:hypothetical protein n=1 Tax=Bacillus sp. Marseille-P3800 TaxID=2014782 RepID=UPI000C07036D|nr:hypothetical protein [Bacillus sp. Marseille-P3800]